MAGPVRGHARARVLVALAALHTVVGMTAIAALLTRLAWSTAAGPTVALDPAAVLVTVAAGAAALLTCRLVLCGAACVVAVVAVVAVGSGAAARRAAGVAVRTSPGALRPGLSALLASTIVIGVTGPALAATPGPGPTRLPSAAPTAVVTAAESGRRPGALDAARGLPAPGGSALPAPGWSALPAPGWRPTTPRGAPALVQAAPAVHLVTGTGSRSGTPDDEVVVRRGDTLWHLAARALGPSAAAAEIAAEWPRWWRANRDVIGADPDLLVPGTRLRAPAPATSDP